MNKFGAKKTICAQVHKHDSRLEARRCDQLHLLQRGGVIQDLVVQPQYYFVINGIELKHDNGRRVGYKADFSYTENGAAKAEDCKGFSTADWPLRKAVFRACFPDIELIEVRR